MNVTAGGRDEEDDRPEWISVQGGLREYQAAKRASSGQENSEWPGEGGGGERLLPEMRSRQNDAELSRRCG